MGRTSGGLWIVGAMIGLGGAALPGAEHGDIGWVVGLSALVLAYGVGSVTGLIPWHRATLAALGIGMAVTVPVVGVAIYLTGASISYIEPLLVCALLYAAFFFPARWAWPLSIELVLVAGAPLLYDDRAIENAYLPRYIALAAGFLAVTWVMVRLKERLVFAEARQREIANRDSLTGVGNRRAFDAELHEQLRARMGPDGGRRTEDAAPLALLLFDFDEFKAINDGHGHAAGDAVLRRAARRAEGVLRSGDTLARIGGDEFAVIAPGAGPEGARMLADAIRGAVGELESGLEIRVRVSVGWATYPEDGLSFEALIRQADQRMLDLKRNRPRPIAPRPLLRPVPPPPGPPTHVRRVRRPS